MRFNKLFNFELFLRLINVNKFINITNLNAQSYLFIIFFIIQKIND